MNRNPLTPEEQQIILLKGTEMPFSGEYNHHRQAGVYCCKQCDAPLYRSSDKFDSGCGWPAFDQEIYGQVRRQTDADGRRVEILCRRCNGHLGHVFEGEGLTLRNVRHCVNSLSMRFIANGDQERIQRAIFGSGCFWGTAYFFEQKLGVLAVTCGFMGGNMPNPSYQQVCEGSTGHVEVVEVWFDQQKIHYEALVKFFFETHDFSQEDGQGADIGSQYLSTLFYCSPLQREIAENVIAELRHRGYSVATQLREAQAFYSAENYHQKYYQKNGKQPYCHTYTRIF